MLRTIGRTLGGTAGVLTLIAMATAGQARITGMDFLSSTQIATGTRFDGNLVFGLSGIDYDARTNRFISQRDNFMNGAGNGGNPMAFVLAPEFAAGRPGYTLRMTGADTLGGGAGLTGLESIRYDPQGDGVWVTSEAPNTVYHVAGNGTRTQLNLPAAVAGRTPAGGDNYGLEGLTFTPGGDMWVSRENSQSGDPTNVIRLSNIARDGSLLRQYAYTLDTVVATNRDGAIIANPPGAGVGNNGVSEILALSDTQFLVMERAWDGIGAATQPQGVSHNYVRIYSVDLSGGSDVAGIASLDGAAYSALSKTLLFDSRSLAGVLDTYDTKVDNIEGMSFGATLPDGRRSLVLVSDNNNSGSQRKTQFLVLGLNSVVPEPATWAMMLGGFGLIGGTLRRQRTVLRQS